MRSRGPADVQASSRRPPAGNDVHGAPSAKASRPRSASVARVCPLEHEGCSRTCLLAGRHRASAPSTTEGADLLCSLALASSRSPSLAPVQRAALPGAARDGTDLCAGTLTQRRHTLHDASGEAGAGLSVLRTEAAAPEQLRPRDGRRISFGPEDCPWVAHPATHRPFAEARVR
ncbi:hypothetical protein FA09DRAFT_231872 [Tilletiopsis washingtonensis]|uniref:Uncharacterized protein n=1 Tax=Tilletiopsis washingtonensis TaxID=58919 RepID=A0A316ZCE7_9BASI|nr:hypothetical protein FA09DRAFT_231872 [Tilletiopsis washingtonensis]PWN99457.1 hypothetical protein FA09DRAFT_231872 [Tilletiopsis washingtonensis]